MSKATIAPHVQGRGEHHLVVELDSPAALAEVIRIQTAGRPCTVRIAVQADSGNVDSITDCLLSAAVVQDGELTPQRASSDFGTSDAMLQQVIAVDATGAAVNFPTAAIGEGGAMEISWQSNHAEIVISLQGVATLDVDVVVR